MPLYKFDFPKLDRSMVDRHSCDGDARYVAQYVAQQMGCEVKLSRKKMGRGWRKMGRAVPDPKRPMGWAVKRAGS